MSDEPQPQQPNEGVPPEKPLPAEGPGDPGGRDATAPDTVRGTGRPTPSEPAAPAEHGGQARQAAPGRTGDDRVSEDRPAPDRTASMARARQAARGGRTEGEGSGSGRGPADRDASAAGGTRSESGARVSTASDSAAGAGSASGEGSGSGRGPVDRDGSAAGGSRSESGARVSGSGAAAASGEDSTAGSQEAGRPGQRRAGSGKPQVPEARDGSEQTPSAESTQVLRRVAAPRAPQGDRPGAGDTPVPETTQVLRRVNAPRAAEPGDPAKTAAASPSAEPNPTGRTSRASGAAPTAGATGPDTPPRAAGPRGGTNRTAQAAGAAGAAAAAGAAGAAGQGAQAAQAGAVGAVGAGARRPRTNTAAAARTTTATPEHGAPQPTDENTTAPGGAPGDGRPAGGQGKGKKPKRKRTGWRRIIPTWRMVLGTFVIGLLLLIGLFFLGYSLVKIPPANALATKQANVYLYADGSQIARDTRDSQVNREKVGLAQVSKDAQHAVLAAEDRDFYTESAVDPKAMLRAAWNTATGKGTQSGSTITQQYVKNYYLGQEQTLTRKAKEFFIAIKLDRNKTKDEILEGYLNTSFFGRNAYGIQAAAQAYYGRDAADLDPARAAYLAALVNAPSEYDVVAHPENKAAAVARWNYVLDGMVKKGWLSESKRAGMKFPMPKEQTLSTGMSGQRGYLVDAVKHYLVTNKILTTDQLEAGGYRITTTIQKNKQNAFVKAVNDNLISKLDKKNITADKYVRAGGASVDPKTGKVVAMYGGIDYVKQYTNGATRGDFQVGSTFKPFVFTSAVQNGSTTQDGRPITPNTMYDGTNQRPVEGWNGGAYAPENEDQKSYGQITVTKATDLSVNAVYAQMAVDVGPSKVKQTAIDLGVPAGTPDLQPYPSIALGTATASVLDMAESYATLANHGRHGTYTMIDKITKDGTDVVKLPDQPVEQAVSREAADTTTSMLQSVVDNGTATAAQGADRPAAGKTGTAENDTAAWFAGYTPDLATVVSVMGQDPVTAKHMPLYGALGEPRMNGGGPPTRIWAQYTHDALQGTPSTDFDLQLQQGADQPQPQSPTGSAPPGTTGAQNNGGTTDGGHDNGGATASPTTGGTGTPTTGGDTTGGTPTTGGDTTGGGANTTGGDTTGGGTNTTGGDATGGGTNGGATGGGGTATGGDGTGGGGDTTGAAAGAGGDPLT